ncbi:uncharacterized protein LOC115771289 [Drosophila novamexicana]|uniref:uncharacterized protein LOC115771289 n=1 Tax=Drosophila novamexicana TaxID=47314 RepID=UPI0011E5B5AE|nr:uncharacterized protein LOC115771289 [Drosophila novamexicana]
MMSDLEEMDSERLNELESILYASIHYNDATSEQQQPHTTLDMDMDAQSMPPPPQQKEQQKQQHRIVSGKRVINNAVAKPRYWEEAKSEAVTHNDASKSKTSAPVESATSEEPRSTAEQDKPVAPPAAAAHALPKKVNGPKKPAPQSKQPKGLNPVQQLLQQQQQMRQPPKMQQQQQPQKKQPQVQKPPKPHSTSNTNANDYDEPERFDQRLLVAIPPNWSKVKREPGPFGKASRKLEQFQRLAEKRQKSKRVQTNKKLKPNSEGQPLELIDLVDSEKSSDADDVMIVPLPPVPIIDVDASDDEEQQQQQPTTQHYLEENAMDAADVSLGGECATEQLSMAPQLHSPCSSVLSSDDFIVQNDTRRLLAERARATDEDLLVLTENAIREAAEPAGQAEREQAADTSSEYEFVPPSRLEEIKQNYRVDEQQFRALDVYESESDLTESGVYCKAKQKVVPTIIRNVDSESDTTDVEQVVEVTVNKTKRLRKRRASSTNQSQSDPNNECDKDDDDTDSDDAGVQATGVPGIARGMAVERCKRKIRRISQRRSSDSAVPADAKRAPVQEEASSESGAEESLPTARQIAERLLQQEQEKEHPPEQQQQQSLETQPQLACESDEAMDSIGSDANTEDEAEMNDAMTERISAVFKRIDKNTRRAKAKQSSPDNRQQQVVSTTDPEQETELDLQAADAEAEVNSMDLQPETEPEPELALVQVEHNMAGLKEKLRGGDLVGWNDEMCRFYNDSWHGENISLHKILKAMSGQRSDWRIVNADRFPVMRKRSNLKCTNCFEMGHMRSKCPRPRKPVVCYTCGMTGHAEPRCPNAICLGCGAKQSMYVQKCNKCSFHSRMVCQLCKMRGHSTDMCPDKWRRYHSTTRTNAHLESNVQYRVKHCSYCSSRGHLFEECRHRIGEYRNTNYTSRIISHQKVYKDRSGPISYLTDLRSFFDIDTPFHFNWSSEFSRNSCYARFLKAVGLARPVDKRKKFAPTMHLKVYTNDYVPNPQARAARGTAPATSTVTIEEPPAEPAEEPAAATVAEPVQIQQEEISSNYQSKPKAAKAANRPSSKLSTAASRSTVTPHDLDSDSNYSFSEHFEVPSSTTTSNEAEHVQAQTKTGPLENLPDIIPLSSAGDGDGDGDEAGDGDGGDISNSSQGISMCVNSKAPSSSATSATNESEGLPDLPSEAKILMARDQTEYLFSPEGREFLTASAKQCNVNVRMDFKEYGYVLVIYGLKKNQEDLQLMLLRRNQDVKRKSSEFQSQKPPKRIDVLIRFMRDGINSLTGDLGNAKSHYFRIKELEQMNTKNGYKLAERKRRLLNMILFGQAGLCNGNMHLDQLLIILKRLLEEHAADDNASPALRNEIEEHWRIIFSPFPHPNYEALLQSYGKLDVKNRMSTLNIEPALLGQQIAYKPPPAGQKRTERMTSPPPPAWAHDANKNRSPKQRALLQAKWSDQSQQPPPPPVWKHDERAQVTSAGQQQQQQQQPHNNRTPKPRTQPQAKFAGQQKRPLPPIWQHGDQHNNSNNNNHNNNNHNRQRPGKQQRLQPYARLPGPVQQQQQQHQQQLPCNNMQQRAPAKLQLQLQRNRPLQSECFRLLAGMERGDARINTDASKPSMFWSRESLKYLDELFKLTANGETLERLQRVLERSRRGQLSHNDYRAVIRLHSLMEPNYN